MSSCGARAPYAAFFVLAPVIAMLLIRKPGVALVTALIYGLVQTIARGNLNNMVFGLTEGLGAEPVFALFRYRHFDALSAFLAGGLGAKTLRQSVAPGDGQQWADDGRDACPTIRAVATVRPDRSNGRPGGTTKTQRHKDMVAYLPVFVTFVPLWFFPWLVVLLAG